MPDAKPEPEPSMEEILASINRMMADENKSGAVPAAAAANPDDILELTESLDDNGTVRRLRPAPAPSGRAPPGETVRAQRPDPASAEAPAVEPKVPQAERDRLLSAAATTAAAAALGKLASLPRREREEGGPRTLEDIVGDALRPLLQDWLDQHLPEIVERLVREEIARVVKEAGLR